MSDAPLFHVRPPHAADLPFCFSSWLKSYRDSPYTSGIPNTIYYAAHHAVIENILKTASVVIACSPTDADQIFGYAIGRGFPGGLALDWVYVKNPLRGFGIAKALLSLLTQTHPGVLHATHRPRINPRFLADVPYNPYALPGAFK